MAGIKNLAATTVERAIKSGHVIDKKTGKVAVDEKTGEPKKIWMLHDGGGLYLQRSASGAISWIFRYRSPITGKTRDMGLGSANDVTLAAARVEADRLRKMVGSDKLDPIIERGKAGQSGRTFREEFERMNKLEPRPGWKANLERHAYPVIGDMLCERIGTESIVGIIAKLLDGGHYETARKLQQRINAVIRSATGSIETPAHKVKICHTLRNFKKVRRGKPFASLGYAKLPAFYRELLDRNNIEALALAWTIVTNCRTGDVFGQWQRKDRRTKPPMLWTDLDKKPRTWTIPAIKTADVVQPEPFETPLSDAALDVLRRVRALKLDGVEVFPCKRTQPMLMQCGPRARRGHAPRAFTVQGMRSAFKTWASEETNFPREVVETQMAHKVFADDPAERAYMASVTFMRKRRALMQAWADHVAGKSKIVKLAA